MTIIEERTSVAKKQYTCDLCGCKIEPGQKYKVQKNADGGDFWTFRCHKECDDLALKNRWYWEDDDGLDCNSFCDMVYESIDGKYHKLSKYEQVKLLLKQ